MALKMGMFSDAKGFIQVEGTNVGARPLCLQSYAGNVGIGTTNPTEKLVVGGNGSKICIGNKCLTERDFDRLSRLVNDYESNRKTASIQTGAGGLTYGHTAAPAGHGNIHKLPLIYPLGSPRNDKISLRFD